MQNKEILWFNEINKNQIPEVGGKGANLGEMYNHNFPIPGGFVITAYTYKKNALETRILKKIEDIEKNIDVNNITKLNEKAAEIKKIILNEPIKPDLKKKIVEAYIKLGGDCLVAVRSSATAEDLPSISENEHILTKINGNPFYRLMKEFDGLNPNKNVVEIPSLYNNEIVWKKVSAIYKHPANSDKLYKIKTVSGREVTISPNHSLIILDENNLTQKTVKVSDLKGGEKVPTINHLPELNCKNTEIDVLNIITGKDIVEQNNKIYIKNNANNWKTQQPLPQKIKFTKDLAYFLGIYCAEGSTYKNNCITITNSNSKIRSKSIKFIKHLGINTNVKINKYSLRVYCKALVKFLHTVAGVPLKQKGKGKLSLVKRVPEFVFGWKKELIGEFLKGAFDEDGGIEPNGIGYSSTSLLLTGGLIKLLEILNIEFSLKKYKSKNLKWHDHYRILIPAREGEKFKNLIGFVDKNKLKNLNKLINSQEQKSSHPEFMHCISITPELTTKIKAQYDSTLPKTAIKVRLCPQCKAVVNKSSKYKKKERYYCNSCHRAYYEQELPSKEVERYVYYDIMGKFKKYQIPWNKGLISGTLSQKSFSKEMNQLGITDYKDFFTGSVRWDKIKSIEEVQYTGQVYDFTVPEVENFAAGIGGIITHNSASFAGQQDTYLNILGKEKLLENVKKCWASLFNPRAIFYRRKQGFPIEKVKLAVVVQKQVASEISGIMFTANPTNNNLSEIVIEACYGLGEAIVSGSVTPDTFIIDKKTMKIKSKIISKQSWKLIRDIKGTTKKVNVPIALQAKQKISDNVVLQYAKIGNAIEKHYDKPQDIEWAIEKNKLYVVQSRPITTLTTDNKQKSSETIDAKAILSGLGASFGIKSGPVIVVHSIKELDKVKTGDVMVTKMTTPDMVPQMKKAIAIVTDEGGITCHASIVSRELGIPCIVGTETATKVLRDKEIITVDANKGKIYKGVVVHKDNIVEKHNELNLKSFDFVTTTKVKVNLAFSDAAQRAFETNPDGIGLMRAEHILTAAKEHPYYMVHKGKSKELQKLLETELEKIMKLFKNKPVYYRTFDARTDEYRNLKGGETEPKEDNPMLGWHGIRRDIDEPEILKTQFRAIKNIIAKGYRNIGIMIPFTQHVKEYIEAKRIAESVGLKPHKDCFFGIMVETPGCSLTIEDYIDAKIDFVSFGTNDLTQLTLGLDRNNEKIQKWFTELHPSILKQIAHVISFCKPAKVRTSICGQAGSNPEMVKELVKIGIDSISANIDSVDKIKEVVYNTEKEMLLDQIKASNLKKRAKL